MRDWHRILLSLSAVLASAASGCGESNDGTEIVGELTATVSDDFQHGTSTTDYWLKTDSGVTYRLRLSEQQLGLPLGSRVSIKGSLEDGLEPAADSQEGTRTLRVDELTPLAGDAEMAQALSGPRSVVVVLMNFTNDRSQPLSANDVYDLMFGDPSIGTGSVNAFYQDQSFGLSSFNGWVFDWCQSGCAKTCDADTIEHCANLYCGVKSGFNHVMYMVPSPGCSWAGRGNMPGSKTWVAVPSGLDFTYTKRVTGGTAAHELGHNLGLDHANILNPNGSIGEYGDSFEVMGGALQWHLNAPHKMYMGWFPYGAVAKISRSGIYWVTPLETTAGGTKVLELAKRWDLYSDATFVSYRQPWGFDANMYPYGDNTFAGMFEGASIHRAYQSTQYRTALIDPHPGTMNAPEGVDGAMSDGQTFNVPGSNGNVTITQIMHTRDSNAYAKLAVQFSGDCVPDGGIDDVYYLTSCCSGVAVAGSTVCSNPADYGTTWQTCDHICGTPLTSAGCVPSGGIDDVWNSTSCCSGAMVPNSTWCLNPADWGTTWASCVHTCK